jgi:hypothetical protein
MSWARPIQYTTNFPKLGFRFSEWSSGYYFSPPAKAFPLLWRGRSDVCVLKHSCYWSQVFVHLEEVPVIESCWIFRDLFGFRWSQDRFFCNSNSNGICTVCSWIQLGEFLKKVMDSNWLIEWLPETWWNFPPLIAKGSTHLRYKFEPTLT